MILIKNLNHSSDTMEKIDLAKYEGDTKQKDKADKLKAKQQYETNLKKAINDYNSILQEIQKNVINGRLSPKGARQAIHDYKNTYLEKCKDVANESQMEEILAMLTNFYKNVDIISVAENDVLRENFKENLNKYIFHTKGSILSNYATDEWKKLRERDLEYFGGFIFLRLNHGKIEYQHFSYGSTSYLSKQSGQKTTHSSDAYGIAKYARDIKPKIQEDGGLYYTDKTSKNTYEYTDYIGNIKLAVFAEKIIIKSFSLGTKKNPEHHMFNRRILACQDSDYVLKLMGNDFIPYKFDTYPIEKYQDISFLIDLSIEGSTFASDSLNKTYQKEEIQMEQIQKKVNPIVSRINFYEISIVFSMLGFLFIVCGIVALLMGYNFTLIIIGIICSIAGRYI